MGQTVELLENALRAWEDCLLLDEVRVRSSIATGFRKPEAYVGRVRHWRELRNHLLGLQGGDFDIRRFCLSEGGIGSPLKSMMNAMEVYSGFQMQGETGLMSDHLYDTLPLHLASWTISSRRVFQLSDELVACFTAADYSAYRWSDLLWPFDSFLIQFESPLRWRRDDDEEIEGLGMLISSIYGVCREHELAHKDGFECLPFYRSAVRPNKESILGEKDRDRFEKDLRHKHWRKLSRRLVNFAENFFNIPSAEMALASLFEGNADPMLSGLENLTLPPGWNPPRCFEKNDPIENREKNGMHKILAGLCLYLEALPAGMMENYPWHQPVTLKTRREVRKIITDGEQICHVADLHTISPETITLFPDTLKKGPAYSVKPHWRRAHYRRKKGQGHNPDAPRDQYVGPAKIHADQLPEGTVVGGAISLVK